MNFAGHKPRKVSARDLLAVAMGVLMPVELCQRAKLSPGKLADLLLAEGLGGLALDAFPEGTDWLNADRERLLVEQRDLSVLEELREWALGVLLESLTLESQELSSQALDSQPSDSQTLDSQFSDSQTLDSRISDSQTSDSQTLESQLSDSQTLDQQTLDSQTPDSQTPDSQTSDSHILESQPLGSAQKRGADGKSCADTIEQFPLIALKGFDSARRLYASPTHRPAGDVDLLISCSKEHWARLEFAGLTRAGFRELHAPGVIAPRGGWNTRTFKQGKLSLDLHHQLFRGPPYRFPAAELAERSVELSSARSLGASSGEGGFEELGKSEAREKLTLQSELIERRAQKISGEQSELQDLDTQLSIETRLRVLDPLDAICFHVAHLAKHGFRGPLIRWVDLKLMLESWLEPEGDCSWVELEMRAKNSGTLRVLRLALVGLKELGIPPLRRCGGAAGIELKMGERMLFSYLFRPHTLPSHSSPISNQALFRLLLVDSPLESWASAQLGLEWLGRKLRQKGRRAWLRKGRWRT